MKPGYTPTGYLRGVDESELTVGVIDDEEMTVEFDEVDSECI